MKFGIISQLAAGYGWRLTRPTRLIDFTFCIGRKKGIIPYIPADQE
jgi:hypothetical protein